jgi:hypothetical protein
LRHVHDLANLLGVSSAQGSSKDRKILAKAVDETTIHITMARDDAVARNMWDVKFGATMCFQHIQFLKGAVIEKKFQSFSGSQAASLVNLVDTLLSSTDECLFTFLLEELSKTSLDDCWVRSQC